MAKAYLILSLLKLLNLRFVKFCLSGGINALISCFVYYLLLYLHVNYILAATISFVFGTLFSYTINSLFIFHQKIHYQTLFKYILIYLISYCINMGLMLLLVEVLLISQLIAPIICLVIMAIINYYLVRNFALVRK